MAKSWYLVAYDVREPRRLRRAAKHLEGYGTRLQYSIFRCKLSIRQLERMQWELTKILDTEDDILIIGLCGDCVRRVRTRNSGDEWTMEELTYEIL
jgi:CRISPR-associated protein Cas2